MLSRRSFLAQSAALAAAASPATALAASKAKPRRRVRDPLVREGAFSLGVASGAPSLTGTSLWTRVDGVERNSRIRMEVARDPGFSKLVDARDVRVPRVRDFTVHADVSGLKPGEQYFYRFETKTQESPVGRFRTARPADSKEPVRVGFYSCQDWISGYWTSQAGLAAEDDLDLVVCLGDYVYEQTFYPGPPDRVDRTGGSFRESDPAYVVTLEEWRRKYRLYKSDPNLQALHAAHPFVAIWDDHEVEDNYAGDGRDTAKTDTLAYDFKERRRAGYLSWFEYMPRLRKRPVNTTIYGSIPLGSAEVFLLDQRQYRDKQPCTGEIITPCAETETPGRTFLGAEQKQWFKDAVAGSKARWKLVANQLMIMSFDSAPGLTVNVDAWDGYSAERREVLQHFADRDVKGLSFLTGDIHTFFAGDVHTGGRVTTPRVASEFVGGSASSLGFEHEFPEPALTTITTGIPVVNPHIKYVETRSRGYGIAEASADELRVTFRSPQTTLERTSPVRDLATFRVAHDDPSVERTR